MSKSKVTPARFVATFRRAIEQGQDPTWIAAQLGMSRTAVNTRAASYRRMGVQLPYFPRVNKAKIDVDYMNSLLNKEDL